MSAILHEAGRKWRGEFAPRLADEHMLWTRISWIEPLQFDVGLVLEGWIDGVVSIGSSDIICEQRAKVHAFTTTSYCKPILLN